MFRTSYPSMWVPKYRGASSARRPVPKYPVPKFHIFTVYTLLTLKLNSMSIYLPKREELSFLLVLALPNASSTGLLCRRRSLTRSTSHLWREVAARNLRTCLLASVLPAPDSPEITRCCSYTHTNDDGSNSFNVIPFDRIIMVRDCLL